MKRILAFATAAFIFTTAGFAQEGKKCGKGKSCCDKKEAAKKVAETRSAKTTASLKKV